METLVISAMLTGALVVVSLLLTWLLLRKQKYRALFRVGMIWFFAGLALMAVYIILRVPFWVGLPLSILGLAYQVVSLFGQRRQLKK
jgi:hypothetical protein